MSLFKPFHHETHWQVPTGFITTEIDHQKTTKTFEFFKKFEIHLSEYETIYKIQLFYICCLQKLDFI